MNPILVEVTRGDTVESVHRGAVVVTDTDGKVVMAWGDVDAAVCPRSSIKPMQALPLVESGAAEAFKISEEELALACASHGGEPEHVDRVAAWLARAGLSVDDLECGAHPPSTISANEALIRQGVRPCPLHNNCSGKHTGFLCLATHLKAPTKGYVEANHPVQRAGFSALADLAGVDLSRAPAVRDGCNAPNTFLPLKNLATAWARFGAPDKLPAHRAKALNRIRAAMKNHPFLFSGTDRACLTLTKALKGGGVAKTGAEAVFTACVPEQGLGIALKIDDGATRASQVAITAILKKLGALNEDAAVEKLLHPAHHAWAGPKTGVIRPAFI